MPIRPSLCLLASLLLASSLFAQDYTAMSRSGYPQTAQTVTNGQAVTLSNGINVLTSSGQDNGYTNTITLANVAQSNVAYWLVNADASTNLVAIAKSGNWKPAAVELAAGEAIYIVSTATNAFRRGDAGAALAAQVAALQAATNALNDYTPHYDTNAVTDATLYEPRRIGDTIWGQNGEGTSAWFIAVGETTNDWENVYTRIQTAILLVAQQRDTNAVTDATEYTPRYFGDLLVGRTDAATGSLWLAIGLTTNDWDPIPRE